MNVVLKKLLPSVLLLCQAIASPEKTQTPRINPGRPQGKTTSRPSQKSIAVRINGRDEVFTFILFNQSSFPFTTYVPQAFREESGASDEGYAIRWIHASKRGSADAFVHIFFSTYIKSEAAGRASVRETAASNGSLVGRPVGSTKRFRWSLAEHDYVRQSGENRVLGIVALGRHAGRYFTVMIQQPERYEEEFMPLAYRLLEELIWEDTKKRMGF